MVGRYPVITLCGSTRFKDAFLEAQKRLTLEGTKEMLDDMHKRKIDMADAIYVVNVGGYVGESTRSEIEYARRNGKRVEYLEPER